MVEREIEKVKSHEKRGGRFLASVDYAAAVLPMLAVGIFSYLKTKRDLTEPVYSQKRSTAHLTAISVKKKFDRLKDIGVALATRVQFRRLVEKEKWQEAIKILQHVPKDFPSCSGYFWRNWPNGCETCTGN